MQNSKYKQSESYTFFLSPMAVDRTMGLRIFLMTLVPPLIGERMTVPRMYDCHDVDLIVTSGNMSRSSVPYLFDPVLLLRSAFLRYFL